MNYPHVVVSTGVFTEEFQYHTFSLSFSNGLFILVIVIAVIVVVVVVIVVVVL